jgi:hypothetical protein
MMTPIGCLKVFIAQAFQSILMSDDKAAQLSKLNQFHQPVQLLALVVQTTANILLPSRSHIRTLLDSDPMTRAAWHLPRYSSLLFVARKAGNCRSAAQLSIPSVLQAGPFAAYW